MLSNINKDIRHYLRVIILAVCIIFLVHYIAQPVLAYDSFISIQTNDAEDDTVNKVYHTRLPVTRASYASVLNTAKSLNYYDGTDVGLYEPVKRCVYATIFNRVANMTSTPKLECCMGSSPDFFDLSNDMWYSDEVKLAAFNGYLCTREGSRAEDYLTYKEFYQMLNKFVSSMEWKSNHSTIDCQTFRNYFSANNPGLNDLPDTYVNILCNLFVNDMLPVTSEGELRLGEYITKYDVIQWAVAYTDLKVLEHLILNDPLVCESCILSDIEPWYDKVEFPLS